MLYTKHIAFLFPLDQGLCLDKLCSGIPSLVVIFGGKERHGQFQWEIKNAREETEMKDWLTHFWRECISGL